MSRKIRRPMSSGAGTPASGLNRKSAEFNPDYSDIIKDLRRIGMLAGSFITILVILSFFLR